MKLNTSDFVPGLTTTTPTSSIWNNTNIKIDQIYDNSLTWTYNLGTSPTYKDLVQQIANFATEK